MAVSPAARLLEGLQCGRLIETVCLVNHAFEVSEQQMEFNANGIFNMAPLFLPADDCQEEDLKEASVRRGAGGTALQWHKVDIHLRRKAEETPAAVKARCRPNGGRGEA